MLTFGMLALKHVFTTSWYPRIVDSNFFNTDERLFLSPPILSTKNIFSSMTSAYSQYSKCNEFGVTAPLRELEGFLFDPLTLSKRSFMNKMKFAVLETWSCRVPFPANRSMTDPTVLLNTWVATETFIFNLLGFKCSGVKFSHSRCMDRMSFR